MEQSTSPTPTRTTPDLAERRQAAGLEIVEEPPESHWAKAIRINWQQSVESILEVGRLLVAAKADLPAGTFENMIKEKVPFSTRTARRLMAIARHPVLSDRTLVSALPPAWGTLAELSRVEPGRLAAAIGEGLVSPDMTREDTRELVYRAPKRAREANREAEAPDPTPPGDPTPQTPTPQTVLREIATETGELVAKMETLWAKVERALESGDFGSPRARVEEYSSAEHLQDLACFLEHADKNIGGTYDDLAIMLGGMPTRSEEP